MAKSKKVARNEYHLTLNEDEAALLASVLFHVGLDDKNFSPDTVGEANYDDLSDKLAHLYEVVADLHPPTDQYAELHFEIVD